MQDLIRQMPMVLLAVIISMAGFWMTMGQNYITRAEASEIASSKVEVKTIELKTQVSMLITQSEKENVAINNNTKAFNELRVEIAALRQILAYMRENMMQ